MVQRVFSLEEANEFLPQVKQHIKLVVSLRKKIRELRSLYVADEELSHVLGDDDVRVVKEELDGIYKQLNKALDDLESLGIIVKDFDRGLVDFLCSFEDRQVYLCWMLGENKVKHWHEVDSGFNERKPIIYIS